MCTAISFNGYFGRTLDYECGFGEETVILPRGYTFELRHRDRIKTAYSIAGMARIEKGYPLFFDAMNEKGLAMAGLNFVGNAYFPQPKIGDVAVFEFIPYVLALSDSVKEAKRLISDIRIVDTPFSDSLPNAELHWMIADSNESIVVESTRNSLIVCNNPVGVLTNNPPFQYHLMNLNNYLNLTPKPAIDRFGAGLEAISRGMGAIGLPGDWSSQSRFVRAAFVRQNASKEDCAEHFFRIMSSVSVPKGCMILDSEEAEYTRYTSCMDLKRGVYSYCTYDSMSVKQIKLRN